MPFILEFLDRLQSCLYPFFRVHHVLSFQSREPLITILFLIIFRIGSSSFHWSHLSFSIGTILQSWFRSTSSVYPLVISWRKLLTHYEYQEVKFPEAKLGSSHLYYLCKFLQIWKQKHIQCFLISIHQLGILWTGSQHLVIWVEQFHLHYQKQDSFHFCSSKWFSDYELQFTKEEVEWQI